MVISEDAGFQLFPFLVRILVFLLACLESMIDLTITAFILLMKELRHQQVKSPIHSHTVKIQTQSAWAQCGHSSFLSNFVSLSKGFVNWFPMKMLSDLGP